MSARISQVVLTALDESKRLEESHRSCVIAKTKERHKFELATGKRLRPFRIVLRIALTTVTKERVILEMRTELGPHVVVYDFEVDPRPYYEISCQELSTHHDSIAIIFVWYYENT